MATISNLFDRITEFKSRVGKFSIGKWEFFELISDIVSRIKDLVQNQVTGVKVYASYAELPSPGEVNVSYKVSNDDDYTKNGYYHWDGSYVKDADIEDGLRSLKTQFLPDKSLSGRPQIDFNHLFSIPGTGDKEYIESSDYDTAWVILLGSDKLTIAGATITRVNYFSALDPNNESYISSSTNMVSSIPDGSKLALITLKKEDNLAGYFDLAVDHSGVSVTKNKYIEDTNLQLGSLFTIPGYIVVGGFIRPQGADPLFITNYLPITGFDEIEVYGANTTDTDPSTGITPVAFYDRNYNYISCYVGPDSTDFIYRISVAEIPSGAAFVRCTRNMAVNANSVLIKGITTSSIAMSLARNMLALRHKVVGKNLLVPFEFLYGTTYSSSSGLVASATGMLSNKLRLRPTTYTIQGIRPYYSVPTVARILAFNDKDELVRADGINLDANGAGNYTVNAGGAGDNSYINYWRIVLQYNSQVIFNPAEAQFEAGSEATTPERCQTELVSNPFYGKSKLALLSGASSSMPGNGYFENACEELGIRGRNTAISGESVMQAATKAWKGTLYTNEELEAMDLFILSHIHNYDVNFEGELYELISSELGYLDASGNFTPSNSFRLDSYLIEPGTTSLLVSTLAGSSSLPYIFFYDTSGNLLGSELSFDYSDELESVVDYEISIPPDTSLIKIKRRYVGDSETKLKGKTTGILCKTVEEYESKGYDENNLPLQVPLDKENENHRIVPYGGAGSSGGQYPNKLYDERYSAGYDYLVKKYVQDCYDLKDNINSKWYGTKSGKPAVIMCLTQWHDGYVRFNKSIVAFAKKHNLLLCDIAGNIGFSYKQTNPLDPNSIRWSATHCNNAAIGSGNDEEDIYINGVLYTSMGWHPTRDYDSYIQRKRARILAQAIKEALTD